MAVGEIRVAGKLVPANKTSPDFPTHQAIYGKGGHRTVENINERDFIPNSFKEEGMTVFVKSEQQTYILKTLPNNWEILKSDNDDGWW